MSKPFALSFLQLEVTAQCNLRCVHCYSESSPSAKKRNRLSLQDYVAAANDAFALGCRSVQIIGGEPAMWPHTVELLDTLSAMGYEDIEYYSNLTLLPERLLAALRRTQARIAFALMSKNPEVHDSLTTQIGSWHATVQNARRLVQESQIRAAITAFPDHERDIDATISFARSLGVYHVNIDRVREVGRGRGETSKEPRELSSFVSELCGRCASGSIYIAASGDIHFCAFSRELPAGSLLSARLKDVVSSNGFQIAHRSLSDALKKSISVDATCNPGCSPNCGPGCNPNCGPACSPSRPRRTA